MKRGRVVEKMWGLTVFTYLSQIVLLILGETRGFMNHKSIFSFFPFLWFNRKASWYFLLLTFTKSILLFSFIIIVLIILVGGSHDRSPWFFSFHKTASSSYVVKPLRIPWIGWLLHVPLWRFLPTDFLSNLYSWHAKSCHCRVLSFSPSATSLFKL